jgi:hypothetical protein
MCEVIGYPPFLHHAMVPLLKRPQNGLEGRVVLYLRGSGDLKMAQQNPEEQRGVQAGDALRAIRSTERVVRDVILPGQQLNCAFVSEEALDGDRNSFANAKLFGDQDAWIMPAPVAFTLLIDRNLPAVPPEAQRTPGRGGAG